MGEHATIMAELLQTRTGRRWNHVVSQLQPAELVEELQERCANSNETLASLRDRLLRAMLREESPGSNVSWSYCDEEGAEALEDIIGVKREREKYRRSSLNGDEHQEEKSDDHLLEKKRVRGTRESRATMRKRGGEGSRCAGTSADGAYGDGGDKPPFDRGGEERFEYSGNSNERSNGGNDDGFNIECATGDRDVRRR